MKKYKIVIVENDEDEQLFMKEGFDASGLFNIMGQFNSGNDLFDWLSNQETLPEVILSDLNMPGKNGYDIIEFIRASPSYTHIPVIITSTSTARSIMDKCVSLGASDYIVKPDTFIQYLPFAKNLHERLELKHLADNKN